jgi:hypothetical protein
MLSVEDPLRSSFTRRSGLRDLAMLVAGSPLLRGQQDTLRDHSRMPRMDELVTNVRFRGCRHAKLSGDAYQNTALGAEGDFKPATKRGSF